MCSLFVTRCISWFRSEQNDHDKDEFSCDDEHDDAEDSSIAELGRLLEILGGGAHFIIRIFIILHSIKYN